MIRGRVVFAALLWVGSCTLGLALPAVEAQAADAAADQEATEEGGHEGGASANPMTGDPDLAIFTAIVFLVLLGVLWKFAWGPIAEALDRREKGIADQIDEARRSNEEAKRLLAEHQVKLDGAAEEVRALLEKARRDADAQRQQIVADAQEAARVEKERAVREITLAKNQALQDLAEKSVDTAVELAGRIVRRQLTAEDHAELINSALNQLPSDN